MVSFFFNLINLVHILDWIYVSVFAEIEVDLGSGILNSFWGEFGLGEIPPFDVEV